MATSLPGSAFAGLQLLYPSQAGHGVTNTASAGVGVLFTETLPQSEATACFQIFAIDTSWLGSIEFPVAATGQPCGLLVNGTLHTHYRNDAGQVLPLVFQYDSLVQLG